MYSISSPVYHKLNSTGNYCLTIVVLVLIEISPTHSETMLFTIYHTHNFCSALSGCLKRGKNNYEGQWIKRRNLTACEWNTLVAQRIGLSERVFFGGVQLCEKHLKPMDIAMWHKTSEEYVHFSQVAANFSCIVNYFSCTVIRRLSIMCQG